MVSRLVQYWVYGGFLAGILLLVLLPALARDWSSALTVVFLQLPLYMLHQYEEHDNDRFRLFVNRVMGAGKEVLSPAAVWIINIPGVWGVIAASFYLASTVSMGFGLIAIDLTLINAVTHIAAAVALRSYNPGLITAVFLFLPASVFGLLELQRTGEVEWYHHLIGLFVAIVIHVLIVVHVRVQKQGPGTAISKEDLHNQ